MNRWTVWSCSPEFRASVTNTSLPGRTLSLPALPSRPAKNQIPSGTFSLRIPPKRGDRRQKIRNPFAMSWKTIWRRTGSAGTRQNATSPSLSGGTLAETATHCSIQLRCNICPVPPQVLLASSFSQTSDGFTQTIGPAWEGRMRKSWSCSPRIWLSLTTNTESFRIGEAPSWIKAMFFPFLAAEISLPLWK